MQETECLLDRCLAANDRGLAGNAGVTKDHWGQLATPYDAGFTDVH